MSATTPRRSRTEVYVSKSKSEVQVSEASQKESRSGGVWVGKNGGTGSRRASDNNPEDVRRGLRRADDARFDRLVQLCTVALLEHGAST